MDSILYQDLRTRSIAEHRLTDRNIAVLGQVAGRTHGGGRTNENRERMVGKQELELPRTAARFSSCLPVICSERCLLALPIRFWRVQLHSRRTDPFDTSSTPRRGILASMRRRHFIVTTAAAFVQATTSSQPQTYVYKKVAGCELKLDVLGAPGSGLKPVAIWIHGGTGLIRGNL